MDRISGGEPAMHFEAPPTPETNGENEENRIERDQPSHQETAPSKSPSSPSQAVPQVNLPSQTSAQSDDSAQQTAQKTDDKPVITAPLHATDGNNIEKEWVDALKLVEARTKNDPFKQKQEVSRIKADYQLKRFNKKPNSDEALPTQG